ncbi:MAG: 4Fe-4S double cluster binding domain-containing protein [Actinomycetota bacterium]|nr:4Fe-4S double cluster binding domain-containing protein [Actinomycetota bacterium]MDD5666378.1 4Fe-4S double cluster binding domain-containing protein [Actinomycetota bacterium]
MSLKERLREKALELGFVAAGFAGVEPMAIYIDEIASRPEMYSWVNTDYFSTLRGASPGAKHPWSRSLMVLARNYYRHRFPEELTGLYGRCYMVDERKVRGAEFARFKAFLDFTREQGVKAYFDAEVPARMAAASSGIADYGKNCFAFFGAAMEGSSWIEIMPLVLDVELDPDDSSLEVGCPPKCDDRCIKACPTGALYGPLKMNPLRCIAFHTYYGEEITPRELRVPMGTWIYGCDLCQEACPRNRPWMKKDLPADPDLDSRASDYGLMTLLHMDREHYEEKVWPRFFYMSRSRMDRWQMNAARALGNLGDSCFIPDLERSLTESPFPNVRGMSAWSLGRIGGKKARSLLEKRLGVEEDSVAEEIRSALEGE